MKLSSSLYITARLAAASLRPLTLLVLGKVLGQGDLSHYAVFLLIIGLGVLFCGADPHRIYYDRYFKGTALASFPFADYLGKLSVLLLVGAAVTIISGASYDAPGWLIGLAVIAFLIEKGFDELLRFCLFKQTFNKWSLIVLIRVGLNHAFVAVLCLFHFAFGKAISLPAFLAVTTIAAIVALVFAVSYSGDLFRILLIRRKIIVHRFKRSTRQPHRLLWELTRVSSLGAVNHLDRVIIGFVDTAILPSMTLLNMCFGFVQQFVDMFFTSRVRGDLLRGEIQFRALLLSRSLWLATAIGVAASFVAMYMARLVAGGKFDYAWPLVAFYLFLHLAISLTAIFQQMVYWGAGLQRSFEIELRFLSTLGVLALALALFQCDAVWYLCALTAAVGTRALTYATFARRQELNRHGHTQAG